MWRAKKKRFYWSHNKGGLLPACLPIQKKSTWIFLFALCFFFLFWNRGRERIEATGCFYFLNKTMRCKWIECCVLCDDDNKTKWNENKKLVILYFSIVTYTYKLFTGNKETGVGSNSEVYCDLWTQWKNLYIYLMFTYKIRLCFMHISLVLILPLP